MIFCLFLLANPAGASLRRIRAVGRPLLPGDFPAGVPRVQTLIQGYPFARPADLLGRPAISPILRNPPTGVPTRVVGAMIDIYNKRARAELPEDASVAEALRLARAAAELAKGAAADAHSGAALPSGAETADEIVVKATGRVNLLLEGVLRGHNEIRKLLEAARASVKDARASTAEWVDATEALLAGVQAQASVGDLRDLIAAVTALLERK